MRSFTILVAVVAAVALHDPVASQSSILDAPASPEVNVAESAFDEGPDAGARSVPDVFADVDLKLFGRVKALYSYDNFQATTSSNVDYLTYVAAESPDETNFNPRDTRFGFSASHEWDQWKAKAVMEMDFRGSHSGSNFLPRLRHGYLQLDHVDGWQVLAGQAWNPIARQLAPTIDMGVAIYGGNLGLRLPQIRVGKKVDENIVVEVSVFKHRTSNAQQTDERMPWVALRGSYRGILDGKGEVAFAVGGREVTVSGTDYTAWVLVGEWKLPIGEKFLLNGEIWTGEAIGGEFVRSGLDYNLTTMTEIASTGGFMACKYAVNDELGVALGFGIDDPSNDDTGAGNKYNRNMHAFGNVTYKLSEHVGIGLEVNHLETETLAGETLDGQRVQGGIWFKF